MPLTKTIEKEKKIKALKKGESTFRNGGGSICGGVVSQSTFSGDPWAYMMALVMPDDKFEIYRKEKDVKKAKVLLNKYSRSII